MLKLSRSTVGMCEYVQKYFLRSAQQVPLGLTKLKATSFGSSRSNSFSLLVRLVGGAGGHFDARRPLMVDLLHWDWAVKSLNVYRWQDTSTFYFLPCVLTNQKTLLVRDMPTYDISNEAQLKGLHLVFRRNLIQMGAWKVIGTLSKRPTLQYLNV